ncbi:MAG: LPS export ABC transporter periplasmic protein LptC [Candidatus Kapabacteria bacterium]|nr:LPS export ABC transporter periplasmic protein LptC [Candidatus Kapabacteria bacterium]
MRPGHLAAVMIAALASGCAQKHSGTSVAQDPFVSAPSQMATNIVVTFSDSTIVKARLYASVGRVFEQEAKTTMSGPVTVDFFDRDNQRPAARLTSDSCVVDDRTKNMTAIGNVRVVSLRRDVTLTSSELSWIQSTQRIRTERAVRIETPQELINGVGFESNQDLSSYRLWRVSGVQQK